MIRGVHQLSWLARLAGKNPRDTPNWFRPPAYEPFRQAPSRKREGPSVEGPS